MDKGRGSIIVITILATLLVVLGGYVVFDKLLSKDDTNSNINNNSSEKNETNEVSIEKEDETNIVISSKYCEGTYTYNDNQPIGDGELHKQVYTLKKDGTFSGSINDTSKAEGFYLIKDNTIVFIYHPHTYGGPDMPSYISSSYYISEDCSYMSYERHKTNGNAYNVKLTK